MGHHDISYLAACATGPGKVGAVLPAGVAVADRDSMGPGSQVTAKSRNDIARPENLIRRTQVNPIAHKAKHRICVVACPIPSVGHETLRSQDDFYASAFVLDFPLPATTAPGQLASAIAATSRSSLALAPAAAWTQMPLDITIR
jgi:hypothetical protein